MSAGWTYQLFSNTNIGLQGRQAKTLSSLWNRHSSIKLDEEVVIKTQSICSIVSTKEACKQTEASLRTQEVYKPERSGFSNMGHHAVSGRRKRCEDSASRETDA
jgi:hypothetical protein